MQIIYGLHKIPKFTKPVVALGVFDGVHKAHRQIIGAVVRQARRIGGTSVVVTFHPHPQGADYIHSLAHRLRLIDELGVQACIVINFTKAFARISADSFIEDILVARIRAYAVYVGNNFRFGRNARGNFQLLKGYGSRYNFSVKIFGVIRRQKRAISSTIIRRLITRGKLNSAQRLLGRPVSVFGTVVRGMNLATKLGYPTANINPHHEVLPPSGIYAVSVVLGDKRYRGAGYIGRKPTIRRKTSLGASSVGGLARDSLACARSHDARRKNMFVEVHIFGLKKNLYGKDLEIEFIRKIRSDKKFSTLVNLALQIRKDILIIKKSFSTP